MREGLKYQKTGIPRGFQDQLPLRFQRITHFPAELKKLNKEMQSVNKNISIEVGKEFLKIRSQVTFFRTLEINQRLSATRVFPREKRLNLGKKREVCERKCSRHPTC